MAIAARYFGFATSSVDNKNRVTIPAKFRSKLPAAADGKTLVYVMIGPGFAHLQVFDQVNGERRIEELSGGEGLPSEEQRRRQQLLQYVEQVELDKQGRVLLPKELVQYAHVQGEVVVSGAGDHINIFDPREAEAGKAPVSAEKLDPQTVAAIYDSTLPEQR